MIEADAKATQLRSEITEAKAENAVLVEALEATDKLRYLFFSKHLTSF